MAECHPERRHEAKGLCLACYLQSRPSPTRSMSTCHPGVQQHARGLCKPCYQKGKPWPKTPPRMADCHPDRRHRGKGLCNSCRLVKAHLENPEAQKQYSAKHYAKNGRRSHYRRAYNLTLEEVDAKTAAGCAICGTHEGQIDIDHNHITGDVREALCSRHNTGLGFFQDSPTLLRKAADYIEYHQQKAIDYDTQTTHLQTLPPLQ